NTNDGDSLNITVAAFNSGDSGEFQNSLVPTITLFDSNGNPVASGDANNPILYTVPGGAAGTYYVSVGTADETTGEYVLNVSGATGAPDPFTVTATDPLAGSHLQSISSMTVSFSETVLFGSITASNFTITTDQVGGTENATSFTIDNDHTVTFFF